MSQPEKPIAEYTTSATVPQYIANNTKCTMYLLQSVRYLFLAHCQYIDSHVGKLVSSRLIFIVLFLIHLHYMTLCQPSNHNDKKIVQPSLDVSAHFVSM